MMGSSSIRRGDTVTVMTGKDKGKSGRVLEVFTEGHKALVQGVNFVKKHLKPRSADQPGGIVQKENPVHISNLRVLCSHCSKPTRPKSKLMQDGKKVRVCRLCGDPLEEVK